MRLVLAFLLPFTFYSSTVNAQEVEILDAEAYLVDEIIYLGESPLRSVVRQVLRANENHRFVVVLINRHSITPQKLPYWGYRHDLTLDNGEVVKQIDARHPISHVIIGMYGDSKTLPTASKDRYEEINKGIVVYSIPKGSNPIRVNASIRENDEIVVLDEAPISTIHADGEVALRRFLPRIEILQAEAHADLNTEVHGLRVRDITVSIPHGRLVAVRFAATNNYDRLQPDFSVPANIFSIRFSDTAVGIPSRSNKGRGYSISGMAGEA